MTNPVPAHIDPFVDVDDVRAWQAQGAPVVLADSRWYLDERSGADSYRAGHLPGAVFVDLDVDLAGPADETTGRHPLPSAEAFAKTLSRLGIAEDDIVVAYDDAGGVMAARLVWMLRAIGVSAALLDGGISAWTGPLSTEDATRPATRFAPRAWPGELLADIDDACAAGNLVVDARPAQRFAGVGADIDPRSGHIPGAVNVPCRDNLTADQRIAPAASLREAFVAAGITPARIEAGEVIGSCGSGVTACHNLLAMEAAGLGRGRLYPGSWSQYSATDRPVETGP